METFGAIFIAGILYWSLKTRHYNTLEVEYAFKLYALRDKLRNYAIDGKINHKNWIFSYLDTSISKSVSVLSAMNLVIILFFRKRIKQDPIYDLFEKALDTQFAKDPASEEIFNEYGQILYDYVKRKHFILRFLAKSLGMINTFIKQLDFKGYKEAVGDYRLLPNTSTAQNYYKYAH